LTQTTGDCAVCLCADFQDPPELIPRLVEEWENGAQIVSGIKTSSRESKIMYLLRTMYYKLIHKVSDVEQIQHFTGFGLYDRSFLNVMRDLHDPTPFLRGIVAELGGKRVDVEYEQAQRRAGKTHNNWYTLYDAAMLSFTSYTKVPLRIASIGGFVMSVLFFLIALVLFVVKLVNWNAFAGGQTSILMAVLLIGAVLLFFLGLLGEYVMAMSQRVMDRPLVVEQERLNFDEERNG
jgi:glycosyltransferase involved in cell wall biosynthesis